jgi:hypothetical protein
MTEAGISVEDLHTRSGMGLATIGRARRGVMLRRTTQVILFDTIVQRDRCHFLKRFRNRLLVDSPDAVADPDLRAEVLAGFFNYGKEEV